MTTQLKHLPIDPVLFREAREQRGLTLSEAARQLNIRRQRLWNFEKGFNRVPSHLFIEVCKLYGVNPSFFSTR